MKLGGGLAILESWTSLISRGSVLPTLGTPSVLIRPKSGMTVVRLLKTSVDHFLSLAPHVFAVNRNLHRRTAQGSNREMNRWNLYNDRS